MMLPDLRIAFVVQRYGVEVNGGAELLCRWVAEHLSPYADVHVLTTCAQDYVNWRNVYPAGEEVLNGVRVHRFSVDHARQMRKFERINALVLSQKHSYWDELEWMRQQGPLSTTLLRYIDEASNAYDVFIFITYLYPTSYYGLQLVPDKAILLPTAHDEPTLYLSLFRSTFSLPRYMLFNTPAERDLVHSTFDNAHIPSSVIGSGINVPEDTDAARFRGKFGLDGDFILYVGRIDDSKNVSEMFDFFVRFKESHTLDLKLVLVGKGPFPIPERPDIVSLGFVSEQDKFDALQASTLLMLPSRFESLSMAVLEAWLVGKPVLVNGDCDVLKAQCVRSNGGLYYQSYAEFSLALQTLVQRPTLREKFGRCGFAYTRANYSWPVVERKYLQAVFKFLKTKVSS